MQNIDKFICLSFVATIISSTLLSSNQQGICAICAIILTIIKLLVTPNFKISFKKNEIWLLTFFMIVLISVAGSSLLALSLKGFVKTCIYICFYASIRIYFKDNLKKIPLFLAIIACCIGFESIIAIMQNFAKVEAISGWQDLSRLNPEQIMTRVYGTLKPYNPNLLGGYFVAGIPAVVGSCVYTLLNKNYKYSIIFAILLVTSFISLFLTGCRGAYLGLITILFLIFLISAKFLWKKYKTIFTSLIITTSIFIISAISAVSSLRARFLSIFAMRKDSSNAFRFNVYQSSIEMFKDNWLLGIGVGNKNFREIYGLYMKTGFDALSAYNIFLEIAVESGVFALIAFVGFLICTIITAIKFILNSKNLNNIILVSIALISITAILVHGMVDTVFFRPQIQFIFWTMVATISAICHDNQDAIKI
ncbi:MAG: O-antigen ligase family protein [Candidatus Gastranaerophilales bacterium]